MENIDVMKEYFTNGGSTPLFPFDIIDSKIALLKKTMKLADDNPSKIVPKERIIELRRKKVKAGSFLTFYIIQEIVDFYRQAYLKFKDTIQYPESGKRLRKFRGKTIAHINHNKASDIGDECFRMELDYGYENLLIEYEDFKKIIYHKLKK